MPRALRLLARSVALVGLLAAVSACDEAPGPPSLDRVPPTVSDLRLTPSEVDYTGTDATVTIPLQLSVAVDEGSGGATVRYVIRRPFASGALAEGLLQPADGRYAGEVTIEVARGAVGLYVVTVIATGAGGVGNEATTTLRFASEDLGPPVVAGITADPNPITPPSPFLVTAVVSDPDGLANVARVILESGGTEFELCDDGGTGSCGLGGTDLPAPSNDPTAGDGRYTRRFQIPAGTEPGGIGFEVRAYDRAGQASPAVPLIVTVQ